MILWMVNTRDFILWSRFIAWASIILYFVPWLLHLIQFTAVVNEKWTSTEASFFIGLFLWIAIGALHLIYLDRFEKWAESWLYASDICEAKLGWENEKGVLKCIAKHKFLADERLRAFRAGEDASAITSLTPKRKAKKAPTRPVASNSADSSPSIV